MNEINLALSVGIIASLLSIFISIVIASIWRNIILPWYDEHLYKGVEISKKWIGTTKYADGDENEIIYSFKRIGYKITGVAYCINGVSKGKKWILKGTFLNLVITMSFQPESKNDLDQGSASLMLINNGQILKGYITYYSKTKHTMESASLQMKLFSSKNTSHLHP